MKNVVLATAAGGSGIVEDVQHIDQEVEKEIAGNRIKTGRKVPCGFRKKTSVEKERHIEQKRRIGQVRVKLTSEDQSGNSTDFMLESATARRLLTSEVPRRNGDKGS